MSKIDKHGHDRGRHRLKPLTLGRTLQPRLSSGCGWCEKGIRPGHTGLCDVCVLQFKRLLCSTRWQKLCRSILTSSPYCKPCQLLGRHHAAENVDHIYPWRYFPDLFWVLDNLQGMSQSCHSIKTGDEKSRQWWQIEGTIDQTAIGVMPQTPNLIGVTTK